MLERHSVVREGVIAGLLGAAGVAVWFLIVDSMSGRPFYTPAMLGTAMLSVLGKPGSEGMLTHVLVYTLFHGAAFIGVGLVLAFFVHQAEREPEVLAALIILFILFELGFYIATALLAESEFFGRLAWYQVAIGNTIATLAMGVYMWKAHPKLRSELAHAYE
jgi:hypothetical protein